MAAFCKCQRAMASLSLAQRGYGSVSALPLWAEETLCLYGCGRKPRWREVTGRQNLGRSDHL